MRRFHINVNNGQMHGIAFGDPVRPADMLFLHANGFNAVTYQSILEPLGVRAHVNAVDMRGHGRTKLSADPYQLKSWNRHCDDIIGFIEKIAPEGLVLSGHSMGATVAILVAGKRPELVKGLVLVDPVLLAPRIYAYFYIPVLDYFMRTSITISHNAQKRLNQFESPKAAINHLRERGAFKTWRAPFLDDFAIDGFNRDKNNPDIWCLSCTPEWEAAGFRSHRHNPWGALKKTKCPITLICGERNSTTSDPSLSLFSKLKPEALTIIPKGTTHFIPMECPYVIRDHISDHLSHMIESFSPNDAEWTGGN